MDDKGRADDTHVEARLSAIEDQMDGVRRDMEQLLEAWRAANWLVGAVKGLAALVVLVGGAWAVIRGVR